MKKISKKRITTILRQALENINSKKNYFLDDFCGACLFASWNLNKLFKKFGYNSKVVCGESYDDFSHCWVESGNSIYDITATQFHSPEELKKYRVVIVRNKNKEYDYDFKAIYKKNQDYLNWPPEQRPRTPLNKILIKEFNRLLLEESK